MSPAAQHPCLRKTVHGGLPCLKAEALEKTSDRFNAAVTLLGILSRCSAGRRRKDQGTPRPLGEQTRSLKHDDIPALSGFPIVSAVRLESQDNQGYL